MNRFRSKVLSLLIMTIFLLTSSPVVTHGYSSNNGTQCSIDENTELAQFKAELVIAKQNLWDAQGEIKWLKDQIKNSSGAAKAQYKAELVIAKQKLWDAQGEIKWLKDEIKKLEKKIKKLDKECDDNFGYGHGHGGNDNGHTWWKKWGNWFTGNANAFWDR